MVAAKNTAFNHIMWYASAGIMFLTGFPMVVCMFFCGNKCNLPPEQWDIPCFKKKQNKRDFTAMESI